MSRLPHATTRAQNAEHWRALVKDYRAGSLSRRAFCAERGLAPSSFDRWYRRLAEAPTASPASGFLAVPVTPAPPSPNESTLTLTLPGGVRIEHITSANLEAAAALAKRL